MTNKKSSTADLLEKMSAESLKNKECINFTFVKKLHLVDKSIWQRAKECVRMHATEPKQYVDELLIRIRNKLQTYLKEKVYSKSDYSSNFFYEIIGEMDSELQDVTVFKQHFKVDLALHLFTIAIPSFQKMHDQYIQETSPQVYLLRKKVDFYEIFKEVLKDPTLVTLQ